MTIFVKIALDDSLKELTRKEVLAYQFLSSSGYSHIPRLLAVNEDETGFALEALDREGGWEWPVLWDSARLEATLEALDSLSDIGVSSDWATYFNRHLFNVNKDNWRDIGLSDQRRSTLEMSLESAGHYNIANRLDIDAEIDRSSRFVFRDDTWVHYDARVGNCAWRPRSQQVKLVDWTWIQLGDRRIDAAITLTQAKMTGIDVLTEYSNRLDPGALHWVAGFWLREASLELTGDRKKLQSLQLQAGVTAYTLSQELSN